MSPVIEAILRFRPHRRTARYLLAVAIVGGATMLRAAADPLLHAQLPYMFYLASVVVVTWWCGGDAGVFSMLVGAFVANYFFVPARYEFIPHGEDWLAMITFWAVSSSVVWCVGRARRAERTLREANRLKDEFLATLSHELRTPLNAIIGWSDMLRRRTLPCEHADRALESVYRNAQALSEMINDVLDVSRIVSGKVRIDTQPVEPAAVLRNAVESVRPAAEAKGVTIVMECEPVPFPITGDPTRLQQVFWNLLVNAVKFTPSGGQVLVTSRVSAGQVHVQVRDTGIGISREFLPHVFERFRQSDSSTTRLHSGLGLGLAIVRHLVELHGGSVHAESAGEGRGSTFAVRLPAHRFEERRQSPRPVARPVSAVAPVREDAPSLCGARVLVVDDQSEAREVAASVLQHHGASVAVAADAQQALDEFSRFSPTVMLIDIAMPGMDGFGLIKRIRTSEADPEKAVPAIAFTAYAREEDQRRTLANGFQMHLAKPVDSQRLVKAVATAHAGRPRRF